MRILRFFLVALFLPCYASAQLVGGGFKPGYYYDLNGVKNEGYINQKPSSFSRSSKADNAILFKPGKSGSRQLVYAHNMLSYVVGQDSFAVVTLPSSINNTRYRIDFAKVLFDEKVKVYLIQEKLSPSFGLSAGNRGAMPSINFSNYRTKIYLFGSNGNSVEVMDKKNYRDVLAVVFRDNPLFLNRLNNNQVDYDEIENLSKEYDGQRQEKLKANPGQSLSQ